MIKERNENVKNKKESIVYAILKDGKILLEERIDPNKPFYNYTVIPGGKVEKSESWWNSLEREVVEECGCTPKISYYIQSYSQQEGKTLNLRHLFVVTAVEGVISNKEPRKSKHIWLNLKDAREICKHPSTQKFLDDIEGFINEARQNLG